MTYIINARLECGAPALTLIDAVTGEERLHWRCEGMGGGERAWQNLFKQLLLLSCADRINWVQRVQSPLFGNECVECAACFAQSISPPAQRDILFTYPSKQL